MDHIDRLLSQWQHEHPEWDVRPMAAVIRVQRLALLISERLEQVYRPYGINASGFDVLATLRRAGEPYTLSPSELMKWGMVTSGTMTNRIDRLQRVDLVTREPNPKDARGCFVSLTPKGLEVSEHVITAHLEVEKQMFDTFDEHTFATWDTMIRTLLERIEAMSSP